MFTIECEDPNCIECERAVKEQSSEEGNQGTMSKTVEQSHKEENQIKIPEMVKHSSKEGNHSKIPETAGQSAEEQSRRNIVGSVAQTLANDMIFADAERNYCLTTSCKLKEQVRYEIDTLISLLKKREHDLCATIENVYTLQIREIDNDLTINCVDKIWNRFDPAKFPPPKTTLVFNSDFEDLKLSLEGFGKLTYGNNQVNKKCAKEFRETDGICARSISRAIENSAKLASFQADALAKYEAAAMDEVDMGIEIGPEEKAREIGKQINIQVCIPSTESSAAQVKNYTSGGKPVNLDLPRWRVKVEDNSSQREKEMKLDKTGQCNGPLSSNSNSYSEVFHHMLETSSSDLQFVKNSMIEVAKMPPLSVESAELMSLCNTHLWYLKEVARGEMKSVSKEDVGLLRDLLKNWCELERKLLTLYWGKQNLQGKDIKWIEPKLPVYDPDSLSAEIDDRKEAFDDVRRSLAKVKAAQRIVDIKESLERFESLDSVFSQEAVKNDSLVLSKSNGHLSPVSDSYPEDLHHLLEASSVVLQYVKNRFEVITSQMPPESLEYGELVPTCDTNLRYLREAKAAWGELDSVSKEDVARLKALTKDWKELETKVLDFFWSMQDLEREDIKLAPLKLTRRADPETLSGQVEKRIQIFANVSRRNGNAKAAAAQKKGDTAKTRESFEKEKMRKALADLEKKEDEEAARKKLDVAQRKREEMERTVCETLDLVPKQEADKIGNNFVGARSKIAGDLVTAEVDINDAPFCARNLLTRGYMQDEICKLSGAAISTRGRYMTPEERQNIATPECRPLYLNVQASNYEAVKVAVRRIQEIIDQEVISSGLPKSPTVGVVTYPSNCTNDTSSTGFQTNHVPTGDAANRAICTKVVRKMYEVAEERRKQAEKGNISKKEFENLWVSLELMNRQCRKKLQGSESTDPSSSEEAEKDSSLDEDDIEIISKLEADSIPSDLSPSPPLPPKNRFRFGLKPSCSLFRRKAVKKPDLPPRISAKPESSGIFVSESQKSSSSSAVSSGSCSKVEENLSLNEQPRKKSSSECLDGSKEVGSGNDPTLALRYSLEKYLEKNPGSEWLATGRSSEKLKAAENISKLRVMPTTFNHGVDHWLPVEFNQKKEFTNVTKLSPTECNQKKNPVIVVKASDWLYNAPK